MALSNEEIIEHLNAFLSHEYAAVLIYLQQSFMLRGSDRDTLQPKLYNFALSEMGHIRILADKIVSLGGVPTTTPEPIESFTFDAKDIIRIGIETEEVAINKYGEFIDLLMAEGPRDYSLRALMEKLIVDEDQHRSEFLMLGDK